MSWPGGAFIATAQLESELTPSETITELLTAWSEGDQAAFDRLVPRIYGELRRLAASCLRGERPGHTLQLTGLVHETYLRLIGQSRIDWKCRSQFFGVAAQLMRRILVDHARRRNAARRGDGFERVSLDTALDLTDERAPELLALDGALSALENVDDELSRLVELRFFGGLSNREVAELLAVSEATLARRWRVAKGWLYQHLADDSPDEKTAL